MKKIFLKLFKPFLKDIILDILKDENSKPLIKEFKQMSIKSKNFSIYDMMETQDIVDISLMVEYIDYHTSANKTVYYKAENISDFREILKKFKAEYPYFTGVHLNGHYNHAFGKQYVCDVILNTMNKHIYKSEELHNIIEPILVWINKRPELLI